MGVLDHGRDGVLWVLVCVAAGEGVVRLLFGLVAVHAARRALGRERDGEDPDVLERRRAHRRAVLRDVLEVFKRDRPPPS